MEDKKWTNMAIVSVGSLPIFSVLTGHPIGYTVGIIWGDYGMATDGGSF